MSRACLKIKRSKRLNRKQNVGRKSWKDHQKRQVCSMLFLQKLLWLQTRMVYSMFQTSMYMTTLVMCGMKHSYRIIAFQPHVSPFLLFLFIFKVTTADKQNTEDAYIWLNILNFLQPSPQAFPLAKLTKPHFSFCIIQDVSHPLIRLRTFLFQNALFTMWVIIIVETEEEWHWIHLCYGATLKRRRREGRSIIPRNKSPNKI